MNRLRLGAALGAVGLALGMASARAADIVVGVAQALSGGAAQYGVAIRNGFQLAADEINAAGGIGGRRIRLVVEDEQGRKEEAIHVYRKLIFQDQVLMVFGPTLSNSAAAVNPIAQGAKVVNFGTSHTADGITAVGPYIFRNAMMEADVLPETIRVAVRQANIRKVAILYGNDDVFTRSGYDNFRKALQAQKIPVVATETFAKGDVDFKAQLTKIKAANPDAVVLSALIAEGAPILVQARQLGLQVPFIAGNGMNSTKVFELTRGAADNLYIGSPWSASNATPANVRFIQAYTDRFRMAPDQYAAQAYDALYIAAQAFRQMRFTGNLAADRVDLANKLPHVQWTGVTGPFRFRRFQDKGYDAQQTPIVSVTRNGAFVIEP